MQDSTSKNRKTLQRILAIVFWLFVWQLISMAIRQEFLLASPFTVLKTFVALLPDPGFWRAVGFSFTRIVTGFFAALAAGILLAILSANYSFVAILLEPITLLIKSTPVASFIILVLLWVSSSKLSAIIAFLMVFPVIYTNTLQGIRQTDPKILEMAQVFRVPRIRKFLYIYLHAVMPSFIAGCSVALGLCWKSGIAAEVIGLPTGSIGERLYQSKIFLSSGDLFAWTMVIILISFLFEKAFLFLLRTIQRKVEKCA